MQNKVLTGMSIILLGILFAALVVANQQPIADAGPDQVVEAQANCAANVTLDGTGSSDPDGDQLAFAWTGLFGTATGATPLVNFPLGAHEVLLTVTELPETAGLSAWSQTTPLPEGRAFHSLTVANNRLYVIGGENITSPDRVSTVFFAPINTDGTIGTWVQTSSFTQARRSHTTIVANNVMYLLGGTENGIVGFNDVQYAHINPDGTLTEWQPTTSFQTGRWVHSSFTQNGFVYVIGGGSNTGASTARYKDVQFAPINPDGSLGAWQTTTPLPTERLAAALVVYNGYVYILGGTDGPGGSAPRTARVDYARINNDGTLGPWQSTTPLPFPRVAHSAMILGGHIVVLGGEDTSNALDVVNIAPINADGSVGAWTTTTPFPHPIAFQAALGHTGFVYVSGGQPNQFWKDVYVSEFVQSLSSSDSVHITVNDSAAPETFFTQTPPTITNATTATFAFEALDNCSTTFEESLDGAPFSPVTSPRTISWLIEGTHTYRVRAIDTAGNVDPTPASYMWKIDTTPPHITNVTANPNVLWPPNHRMVQTGIIISSDTCDLAPTCAILSVSSNEQVNGAGDGDQAPDWQITGNLEVSLRAERSGLGIDRSYNVTVGCVDTAGNSVQASTIVRVPHDKS